MSTATPTAPVTGTTAAKKNQLDPRLQNTQIPKYAATAVKEIADRCDFRSHTVIAAAVECFKSMGPDEQFNMLVEAKRAYAAVSTD